MRSLVIPISIIFSSMVPGLAIAKNSVVVSISERHLYLIDEEGRVIKDYEVVVGKPSTPTPPGVYKITSIRAKPTWYVPESIMSGKKPPSAKIIPPGPKNPLGAYFLRLNDSSYGIHGTIAPKKVPSAVSAGCVRMRNEDVTELASMVKTGTEVKIIKGDFEHNESDETFIKDAENHTLKNKSQKEKNLTEISEASDEFRGKTNLQLLEAMEAEE